MVLVKGVGREALWQNIHHCEETLCVTRSPLWDSRCPPAQNGIYSDAGREERGVDSKKQVTAACGLGTSRLCNSPLLPEESPSSLCFMYPTPCMNTSYVPGPRLMARSRVHL